MYMCIHLDLLQVEMYLNVHCYTFQMTFLYISDVYKLAIRNIKIISFSNFSNLFTFLSKPPCEGGRVGASLYNTNLLTPLSNYSSWVSNLHNNWMQWRHGTKLGERKLHIVNLSLLSCCSVNVCHHFAILISLTVWLSLHDSSTQPHNKHITLTINLRGPFF